MGVRYTQCELPLFLFCHFLEWSQDTVIYVQHEWLKANTGDPTVGSALNLTSEHLSPYSRFIASWYHLMFWFSWANPDFLSCKMGKFTCCQLYRLVLKESKLLNGFKSISKELLAIGIVRALWQNRCRLGMPTVQRNGDPCQCNENSSSGPAVQSWLHIPGDLLKYTQTCCPPPGFLL